MQVVSKPKYSINDTVSFKAIFIRNTPHGPYIIPLCTWQDAETLQGIVEDVTQRGNDAEYKVMIEYKRGKVCTVRVKQKDILEQEQVCQKLDKV